jgi:eukaryotic-like serine/threonine-protein kinase
VNDESHPAQNDAELARAPGSDTSPGVQHAGEQRAAYTPSGAPRGDQLGEGSRIGGYVLRECIGQGGMARIYRAEHEGLQRQVAVKVLLETPGGPSDGHERFLREARIAAAIKHRNVVNIFDVGIDRGIPFLVMELLEGADLDTFMGGKNRLDEATTMDIVVPIASALATVHDAGIVHRDLKPGNIFLARGRNDELEPRLLDFGISKSLGDQLRLTMAQGPVLGTPFYMSPEAASGAEMTALSDQYALGVVLYECVTGVSPFGTSTNFAEIVHRVTTGDFTPPSLMNPQVSKRMSAIIERAMQLDPARRFADMRAMGRELLLLAGQRTRVTWQLSFNDFPGRGALIKSTPLDEPPPVTLRQPQRRRSVLYAAPALLVLLLGGAWASGKLPGVPTPARASLAAPRANVERLLAWLEREPKPEASPTLRLALEPRSGSAEGGPAAAYSAAIAAAPDLGVDSSAGVASDERGVRLEGATVESASAPPSNDAPASGDTVLAVRQALRGASPRARSARKARGTKAAATVAPELTYGTNNAPILD